MNGLLLNRYEIVESLGSGGFGETFLARDIQIPSQRLVLVKRLKPANEQNNTSTELIEKLFEKEAAVLEELGNDNSQIPKLYGYFSEHGEFYLVQEYIKGISLNKADKITSEQAKTILSSLLTTLKYIHSKGIIHRDIKPENIILRDGDRLPVLIDFGAVKETMGTVTLGSGSTVSSVVIGTRGFMAPEQSAGRSMFSTDLYALGLTIIYAITQKSPVEFATNQLTGELDWQSDAQNIDPGLIKILDKAIKMELNQRYSTAEEMYKDLHSLVSLPTNPMETIKVLPKSDNLNTTNFNSSAKTVVFDSSNLSKNNNQNNQSSNNTVIVLAILVGAVIIVAGIGGGLFMTHQIRETEVRIAQAEKEKEEAEIRRIEAEKKIATEIQAKQESEEKRIEQERRKLAEEAAEARLERQRLEQSKKDLSNLANTVNTETDLDLSQQVTSSEALQVINNLYSHLSNKDFNSAIQLYSPALQNSFNSDFFNQFDQVTVENLEVINSTNDNINLVGSNTYYYPDGTSQRERRSYQVGLIDGEPKILNSKFLKVTKPRK